MLSEQDKKEFLEDGLDPTRRERFRKAKQFDVPITMEQYLQWLTDMARWFPTPPRSDVKHYDRVLL
jgi:hypothetical protein